MEDVNYTEVKKNLIAEIIELEKSNKDQLRLKYLNNKLKFIHTLEGNKFYDER